MEKTRWYKNSVFYQIWPRSFKDGNNDGVGDLYGVYEKLDYIHSLGCDGIWFSPLYPSPQADWGYDIADYMTISDEYGGMDAFMKVLDGAHQRGMKVIMDLVVNHTSDEHEWFQKSRNRIDPYTDYYIWRDAKPNGKLPNNWDSLFEGKAWTYDEVRGQYYLHIFSIKQPDLNMDNPLVREEVKKVLRFWLDLGVDGFREDVITFISKVEGLPDDHIMPASKGLGYYNHGPHLHQYLQEFKNDVFDNYDCLVLAEAPMVTTDVALDYIDENGTNELDMMIQFETLSADCLFKDYYPLPFSLKRFKKALSNWQNELEGKGWNMLYIENHDHPRIISRYGSEKYWKESGKTLAATYLFQKGTPFIYQGQEIGMLNWHPDSPDKYKDVQTIYSYNHECTWLPDDLRLKRLWRCTRESARTPVQWSNEENAGFSTAVPWVEVNPNYQQINCADEENDPDSILNFYKKAISLRKSLDCVNNGKYKEHYPLDNNLYVYSMTSESEKILVICSYSEKKVNFSSPTGFNLDEGELILQNYPDAPTKKNYITLRPYETRIYYFKEA